MKDKKIRKTIVLNEEKYEYIEKIKKEKKIKSFNGAIEYLIDHHQNRLSNKIARDIENIVLILLMKEFGLWESNNISKTKNNLKKIFKILENFEKLKIDVLAEIKEEKLQQLKKEKEKITKEINKTKNN